MIRTWQNSSCHKNNFSTITAPADGPVKPPAKKLTCLHDLILFMKNQIFNESGAVILISSTVFCRIKEKEEERESYGQWDKRLKTQKYEL